MIMAKVGEVAQIEFIKDLLRKGLDRKTVLAKVVKKWQNLSTRVIDRRLNEAKKQLQAEIKQIEAGTQEGVQKEIEARKEKILTVVERMEILSSIARGEIPLTKPIVVDKSIELIKVVPDWMDRKSAIAELNKMQGEYAPAKIDHTTKGEKLPAPTIVKLSNGTEINLA